jgi:Fe-S cluster assembly protein SufD
VSKLVGQLADTFERAAPNLPGRDSATLNERRQSALDAFVAAGLPGPRDERWKYTPVRALERREFMLATEGDEGVFAGDTEKRFALAQLEPWRMTFVDGRFVPGLSVLDDLPAGVVLESLSGFLDTHADRLDELPDQGFAGPSDAFALLNSAFMHEGLVLVLPDNTQLQRPVHVVYLGTTRDVSLMSHLRNIVRLGENCEATVIEHWLDASQHDSGHNNLTNTVGLSMLGRGAKLTHLRLQDDSPSGLLVDRHDVVQLEASSYTSHTFDFGGKLVRHDLNVRFDAPAGSCELNGLYVLDGRQHVDNHTRINHASPDCVSHEQYKGVLNDHARGVFDGLVVVQPGADGTDAHQSNANLLLSADAEVDTKPQLEIYADDVKCSHGATVGELDEDALFYLRSRGLAESTARGLLMRGFGMEMIDRVESPALKVVLEGLLDRRLGGFGENGS